MKALSLAVLAFAVLSLGLGAAGKFDGGLLLGTACLICAVSTFRSQKISSFLKIVHILSVNPYLGPLQISLGRMIMDILRWVALYVLGKYK